MKPPVETVRVSPLGRDQLIKLKRQTGIEHWNVLCRWALCASLRESTPPSPPSSSGEGGVEMSWKVFAGEHSDIYAALIAMRCRKDEMEETPEAQANCLRFHLHRGLGYLSSGKDVKTIDGFLRRWLKDRDD